MNLNKELILKGIRSGKISFFTANNEPVACVADINFYFAGNEGNGMTAEEYLAAVPVDDVADEVLSSMQTLSKTYCYVAGVFEKALTPEKREFFVDTPVGKLRVYAKTDWDDPNEFPGVYVDFVSADEDGEDSMLACVEYDSHMKWLQSCLYEPNNDTPHTVLPVVYAEESEVDGDE